MSKMNLNYEMVPTGFQHCAHRECPKAGDCLRQRVYEICTDTPELITLVNPTYAQKMGAQCKFFHPVRTMRYALGFKRLLAELPKKMSDALHKYLHGLLGHTMYYRARRGEVMLDEENQRFIMAYLAKHGYDIAEPFDKYEEAIIFGCV